MTAARCWLPTGLLDERPPITCCGACVELTGAVRAIYRQGNGRAYLVANRGGAPNHTLHYTSDRPRPRPARRVLLARVRHDHEAQPQRALDDGTRPLLAEGP